MVSIVVAILVLLIVGSLCFYSAGAIATWHFFHSPKKAARIPDAPVSVLVPVKGLESGAWENWSSLCEQDYPDYRIVFGVMDPTDPAVPVLEELVRQYDDRAELHVGLWPVLGPNHKDSNVSHLLKFTRTEWIIFVDSDICVGADYLRRVTAPLMQDGVGMVTCCYFARNPRFLGAAVASLGRCVDFLPSVLIARFLDGGVKLGIGPTMVVTRLALDAAGGIVCNRIGSDYNLGKRVAGAGYGVELSDYLLESDTGRESVWDVWQRELRWARTIRFNRGTIYYAQVFCFGVVFCVPLLLVTGFAGWAIGLAVVTILGRYLQVAIVLAAVQAPRLWRWWWVMILRDWLSFGVWVVGGYGRSMFWRGRRLRIEGNGIIQEWEGKD
jgi:ceramide glucosyltransferase